LRSTVSRHCSMVATASPMSSKTRCTAQKLLPLIACSRDVAKSGRPATGAAPRETRNSTPIRLIPVRFENSGVKPRWLSCAWDETELWRMICSKSSAPVWSRSLGRTGPSGTVTSCAPASGQSRIGVVPSPRGRASGTSSGVTSGRSAARWVVRSSAVAEISPPLISR